jgi:hypothetical protein
MTCPCLRRNGTCSETSTSLSACRSTISFKNVSITAMATHSRANQCLRPSKNDRFLAVASNGFDGSASCCCRSEPAIWPGNQIMKLSQSIIALHLLFVYPSFINGRTRNGLFGDGRFLCHQMNRPTTFHTSRQHPKPHSDSPQQFQFSRWTRKRCRRWDRALRDGFSAR